MPLEWERLNAFLIAFGARGQVRDVSGAMSELDSFLRAAPLSIELRAELEARLFAIVMDDPDMPVELLAQLAKHFRWTEIGSGLELNRPDLYARFLYRQSAAHAWLQNVRELAGGPLPRWRELMEVFRVGGVWATPSRAARLLLLQYRWYFVLRSPGRTTGKCLIDCCARRAGSGHFWTTPSIRGRSSIYGATWSAANRYRRYSIRLWVSPAPSSLW